MRFVLISALLALSPGLASAAPALDLGCTAGDAASCMALALRTARGLGVRRDSVKAATLLDRACGLGSVDGCTHFAKALLSGQGVVEDEARARRLLELACQDRQFQPACVEIGHDIALRDETSAKRAVSLFLTACEGGAPEGCEALATAFSVGRGVETDHVKAAALNEKGCAGGAAGACLSLAEALVEGAGVKGDARRALVLRERACALDDADGCALAAEALESESGGKRGERALALRERACDRGDGDSCVGVATARERGGAGGPAVVERLERGCEAGSSAACAEIGRRRLAAATTGDLHAALTRRPGEPVSVVDERLARRNRAGPARARGEIVSFAEFAAGLEVLRRACDRGTVEACYLVDALLKLQ